MSKIEAAIDRIKILECPTGELENRVSGILEDYGIANKDKIVIDRAKTLDSGDAQAYKVNIPDEGQAFVVMAQSGLDDYVAKVVNVYLK